MSESQFNVERATNGLVLTLFLASAIFLGIMLLYVIRDMNERAAEKEQKDPSTGVVRGHEVPRRAPTVALHRRVSDRHTDCPPSCPTPLSLPS